MTFDEAQQAASEIPDLLSYSGWQDWMEQRSGHIGPWWSTDANRRQAYAEWVSARVDWYRDQAAINQGNAAFIKSLLNTEESV